MMFNETSVYAKGRQVMMALFPSWWGRSYIVCMPHHFSVPVVGPRDNYPADQWGLFRARRYF